MAGSSTADPSRFSLTFTPEGWLAAETVSKAIEWVPVRAEQPVFRCAEERVAYEEDLARRAAAAGLQPVRFPPRWEEADLERITLAAAWAKSIGRVVAFSLAALRQVYCAGRDPAADDTILIAAAACELHPKAVLKGMELRTTRAALDSTAA